MFDAHLHVIDPRFPLTPNLGYVPDPFTADDYLERVAAIGVTGGAVVAGSFHGTDQAHLLDALTQLGPAFVGVAQLAADATDDEIRRLADAGVRAIRFNLLRGGSEDVRHLERMATRVHDLAGWHVEVYVDGRELRGLAPRLAALPRVSIDHLGMHAEALPVLLRLVERGVKVKATGFGRVELDVAATLSAIAAVDPTALLFGTDLPSTRAWRPFEDADVALVRETLGDARAALALGANALDWYRIAA
jgi:predicted TIM-barrel fold metal-dependent hydrolase